MPFQSVEDLKASELFSRLRPLQQMGSARLRRFVEVFNRIFERAARGGADESEAETRAIPIALTAARNAAFLPAGRVAEEKEHVFALMASEMNHAAGESVDLTFPDAGDLDAAFAGQPFFTGAHREAPDGILADPAGVIRKIVSRDDLSDDLKAKVDPDIAVVAVASFFDDIPEDERHASISPEWNEVKIGGKTLAIPHNFIITPTPMNDRVLGIGKVASPDNDYKAGSEDNSRGESLMADGQTETTELESKVASLTAEKEDLSEKVASLEAEVKAATELKTKIASLFGDGEADEATPDEAVAKVASLTADYEQLKSKVASMEKAAAEKTANDWATGLVKAGKIASDAAPKWASLYLNGAETAEALAADLQPVHLGEHQAKAASLTGDGSVSEDEMEYLKGAF